MRRPPSGQIAGHSENGRKTRYSGSSTFRPAACSCSVMASTITEPLATTMEEPLARLVAFEPTTFPVVSVYLNTQPDQHGRTADAAPYLHREFKALGRTFATGSPERHSFDQDVERIVAYTADKIDPAANGVDLVGGIGNDSLHVLIETVALRGTRREGPAKSLELAMQIRRRVGRASVLIRLGVQVHAHHRKRGGFKSHQPRQRLFHGGRKWLCDRGCHNRT